MDKGKNPIFLNENTCCFAFYVIQLILNDTIVYSFLEVEVVTNGKVFKFLFSEYNIKVIATSLN